MAKLLVTPEHQIQRLNHILNTVSALRKMPAATLTRAPHSKSWNVLEVLEHLSISLYLYTSKLKQAFSELPESDSGSWSCKVRPWQRFVIEGQRPKGKKRPFKIKTLKRFEPLLTSEDLEHGDTIFERFLTSYRHLKQQIVSSRTRQMKHSPFSSAIGPIVKFYLPEAFEFLLCHAERHMVQIEEILDAQGVSLSLSGDRSGIL
ncbi:MAG: hypothetical protein AAF634_13305 [Bacteroidota bacterium]